MSFRKCVSTSLFNYSYIYANERRCNEERPAEDIYICSNGKKLKASGIKNTKIKTDCISEKTCYTCEYCSNCELKSKCIKCIKCEIPLEERTKHLEISKLFQEKLQKSLERIISDEGTMGRW